MQRELFAHSYPTNFGQGTSEIQDVSASAEAGTFTLSYEGVVTNPIKADAGAGSVQAELEALSTIGGPNVHVTSSAPGEYIVLFQNALGHMKVAELEVSGASVAVATEGLASGTIDVDVFNIGAAQSNGTITVTDTLPPGLKAKEAARLLSPGYFSGDFGVAPALERGLWDCTGNGTGPAPGVAGASVVTRTSDPTRLSHFAGGGGTLTFGGEDTGNSQPALGIVVEAEPGAAEGTKVGKEANHVTISGGEATESASTEDPVTVSSTAPRGGLEAADAWVSNANGTVDRQAGSHLYAATVVFGIATALNASHEGVIAGSEIRNLETEVPPGLIADLHATPQCTRVQLFSQSCPPASMVGRILVRTLNVDAPEQVFNMAPAPNVPAELAFNYGGVPVYISFSLRTGSNYAGLAHVNDVPQKETYESILTLWGTPDDSSHDIWRRGASGCSSGEGAGETNGPPFTSEGIPNYCRVVPEGRVQKPVLTLPTSCLGPEKIAVRELSGWTEPGATSEVAFSTHDANDNPVGLEGCGDLGLEPQFLATPKRRPQTPSRASHPTSAPRWPASKNPTASRPPTYATRPSCYRLASR